MLPNRAARGGATTVHGWPAVLIGILVTGVGLGIAGVATGAIAPDAFKDRGMPGWIIALAGGIFAVAGLSVLIHGVRGIGRMDRVKRMRAAHPVEPWRWDHPWDERVARDDTASRARHFLVMALFIFAGLTPFHWIGFFGPKAALPFGIVALFFDAIGIGLLAAAGYFALRRLKYGAGVARFGGFPFRRGSTLELHVDAPRAFPQHALATATLRCVQERYVTSGTGEDRTTSVQCFEVYRDAAPAELVAAGAGRHALRVRFAIPPDVPTTDLASRPCRYWEVDVEARTDGVDYATRFLVPVY
ncbi:MAG: hypothetical protein M3303_09860 [Gemmatimonadota bacterium]|nr:hypothetical protein [Gemmatimonadota bacterium]